MPTPAEMKNTLKLYVERLSAGDADGIVELFAPDGTMEDPVGTPAHQGADALRTFYGNMAGLLKAEIAGPMCAAGSECAMTLLACLTMPGSEPRYLDAVDLARFDETGKIVEMRAFWDPAEMRDAP